MLLQVIFLLELPSFPAVPRTSQLQNTKPPKQPSAERSAFLLSSGMNSFSGALVVRASKNNCKGVPTPGDYNFN